jgi:L-histidine N-alpha-methyltransferase
VSNEAYTETMNSKGTTDNTSLDHWRQFYNEVVEGLSNYPKRLPSKYFYDATGDRLFQQIMHSPDYYPTRCELEIFTTKLPDMVRLMVDDGTVFDLIELGPGDCYKSLHLMKELMAAKAVFNYTPIDISSDILHYLENNLPVLLPDMPIKCLHGEYFDMLKRASRQSGNRKIILCLGGNIANMSIGESNAFCRTLRQLLNPGDIVITGFDLKKNPRIIRAAYDDREGITKKFNLNLLDRINRELGANFNCRDFEHYCSYEPETGSCKSFLVCLNDTDICFGDIKISFTKNEYIWMEISQKYSIEQINNMALANGFQPIINLMDRRKWFVDACWKVI